MMPEQRHRPERVLFDRLSALTALFALAPILLLRGSLARMQCGRALDLQYYQDASGRAVALHRFAGIRKGRDLARLIDIAAGRLAWVGPPPAPLPPALAERAALADQADQAKREDQNGCAYPGCGLVSIWRLQRLTGSMYEGSDDPADYPDHTLSESIAILARYLIARCLAADPCASQPERFKLLDVEIDNVTIAQAMGQIEQAVASENPSQFAFVNPDCLNKAYNHAPYRAALGRMDAVFPDGIGLRIGCRLLGIKQADNVNGTDLFPLICDYAARNDKSLYLFGGQPGVADSVREEMIKSHPGLRIAGTADGFSQAQAQSSLVQEINQSGADILLVGLGAPRQELWLERHRAALAPPVQIGVGGLFDFYSGRISRAPRWLRDIGLEWSWRLLQEPSRMWRRYLIGNPLFLYRVWRQARNSPNHRVLKRFSPLEFGFLKASARFRLRHFAWTLAVFTAHATKRLLDIAVASTALTLLSPLLLLLALLIRAETPGPALFAQTRVGRWGTLFTMYKFRSMCLDAEVKKRELLETNEMQGGVLFKMKQDPRITRLGSLLRKYSLDELPQFWNVLIGDMSLVGPRPPVPSEVSQYSIADRRRLEVKPGITCTWQVSGRSEIAFEDQVELDVAYIESRDVMSDVRILLKTIPAVLMGKGAY